MVPFDFEMESQKKAYDRWIEGEAQALLSIYAEDDIKWELDPQQEGLC